MTPVRVLQLPASTYHGRSTVETESGVVIVGANGSGKTRLGAWIEMQSNDRAIVHRISAQKSLAMPTLVTTSSLRASQADLLWGYTEATEATSQQYKQGSRWGGKPETTLLNDYQKLMVYLFSEEFEESTSFRQAVKAGDNTASPGETKLDKIRRIWQDVLPHRELLIRAGVVEALPVEGGSSAYNGSEMSDGERVIFYAIGQALAAPKDGIIIIDEPELHLHRAAQARLWNAIQRERPDCLFVYITHDLDFAASRIGMPKVWVRSFSGSSWDWRLIPEEAGVPEELLLTVVGSRKPVLFCEGDRSSLDYAIYSQAYSHFTVIPCGNCEGVIHATRSFQALSELHDLRCTGIVDRDQRSGSEVSYLNTLGVSAIDYSEIENVLASETIVGAIATHLAVPDVEVVVARAGALIVKNLDRDLERVAADLTRAELEGTFGRIAAAGDARDALVTSVTNVLSAIDVGAIYDKHHQEISAIVATNDVGRALRIYHHKGIVSQIGPMLGLKPTEYRSLALRLLAAGENGPLLPLVRSLLPAL